VPPTAPTVVDLTWLGDLRLSAPAGASARTLDSASKGRHSLNGLRAHLVAHRAQDAPHRFVRTERQLAVEGDVSPDAVERAIALSRERCCSAWHSMRQAIDSQVTFDLRA